jgi:carbon storage regulator
MLIITRRPGEKIMLGDDTVIEVIEVSGSSVRIGIDAPRSIPVYREEIWRSVKEENAAAAQSDASVLPSDLPVKQQRKDLDSSCP